MIDSLCDRGHTSYRQIGHRAVSQVMRRAGIDHTHDEVRWLVSCIEGLKPLPDVLEALGRLHERYRLDDRGGPSAEMGRWAGGQVGRWAGAWADWAAGTGQSGSRAPGRGRAGGQGRAAGSRDRGQSGSGQRGGGQNGQTGRTGRTGRRAGSTERPVLSSSLLAGPLRANARSFSGPSAGRPSPNCTSSRSGSRSVQDIMPLIWSTLSSASLRWTVLPFGETTYRLHGSPCCDDSPRCASLLWRAIRSSGGHCWRTSFMTVDRHRRCSLMTVNRSISSSSGNSARHASSNCRLLFSEPRASIRSRTSRQRTRNPTTLGSPGVSRNVGIGP